MIKKVYETNEIKKTRKVKKTITKQVIETYQESIPHSRRIHNGATSSGYCLHCGRKLYSSMWKYQGMSDKYLCPNCWYSLSNYSREQYRKKAQEGYYSSETYYTYETRTRYKTITEEVEVDEDYIEKKSKIIFPKPIKYNENNKVYINTINFDDLCNDIFWKIQNENIIKDINEDKIWYSQNSEKEESIDINDLKSFFEKKNYRKVMEFQNLKEIPFNEMIVSEKQTLEEFSDIVGFYPNIPAFIQGHPLNMYNNRRKNVVEIDKSITLYVNLAIDSKTYYTQYTNRGILIFSLIQHLLNAYSNPNEKIKVNLKILDATYIANETIIQSIDIYHQDLVKNLNLIYNMLTSISFYRIVMLNQKINFIKNEKLNEEWFNGQGDVISSNELRTILNLNETDLLVGSIEETLTSGIFMDDDIVMLLKSINLYDEDADISYDDNLKEKTIKDTIIDRNITKLIHVTAKENIESIKKYGILPLTELEKQNIDYSFNDNLRLDFHRDAICLSVTDYNKFLFSCYQKRFKDRQYVVLELSPEILYDSNIKKMFFDYNAASPKSHHSDTNMEMMFKDKIRKKSVIKTRDNKKENEPTSYQAEILFFGKIDPKYILKEYDIGKIYVESNKKTPFNKNFSNHDDTNGILYKRHKKIIFKNNSNIDN